MKWCVPVKDSMKLAVSVRPCIEIAANCRPAIQPSVRVSSATMSSPERFRPIIWLRNAAASEEENRKSAARSSVNWPRTRSRARGRCGYLTGGDDQVHLWRQVFDQKGEGLVDRFGINHVVVVKHEDEALRDGGEFVDQGRQQRFGRRRLRGFERSQHTRAKARRNCLQGRDEIGQKACEVVIPFVQRQPGNFGRMKDTCACREVQV